ncbi:amidohydrolase [Pseudarthrobacter sp. NamB4]|uniref:amidohydrolase n=1 Tax=Pseudarthrobacter sp. NamB4 TaxID=2576837 RepID=UPI0010FE5EAD|nr:amidohydrolase [Pseudarthrobacter sp. NamB4]TLM70712.1 amidohydrolase [Pseudarthrobacter sp. NamB4]
MFPTTQTESTILPARTLYTNATVFTANGSPAEAFVVEGSEFVHVGGEAGARRAAGDGAMEVDLAGGFVLPGFVDAHTHLLMMGQALQKVQLRDAVDLTDLQHRLREAAAATDTQRILGAGWLYSTLAGEQPTRKLLDEAVPDRPVYLDANDLHSVWVNSAALAEMGITRDTPDPIGGRIGRDPETGEADGMLYETAAQQIVWPALAAHATDEDRDAQLEEAFANYLAVGVTSAVDMAVQDDDLAAFRRALDRRNGTLPIRVKGHLLVARHESEADNLAQVAKAAWLAAELHSDWLQICGIKLVVDGVIDSCTAAMKEPYADGSSAEPIWDRESLIPVVAAADAAGLQIALHAIGDEASDIALDALEEAYHRNGPRDRRHRIEHLETVTEANVRRLASLAVVASMQPVHADPAIQDNWRSVLGDHRCERAFPWTEFTDAGATLALSTDAPTAPHQPLANMYVATTRRSALEPALEANLPKYALDLADALSHATRDAAYSCRAEDRQGRIAPGYLADFTVLDSNPLQADAAQLLTNRARLTVVDGTTAYDAGTSADSRLAPRGQRLNQPA